MLLARRPGICAWLGVERLLIAQAIGERIPIVTRDPAFAADGVGLLW